MAEINRSLIIVKAKQPFLDWLHSLDPEDDHELDDINSEPTAYLIPEYETPEEQEDIIKWCADFVFEYELWSWYTDEDMWPVGRDAAMFKEWFDVEFHSIVQDVVGDIPLKHIDYDSEAEDIDPSSNGH
ncbi:MAG TPA: hypothetical protein VIX17_26020 [Pyrinomonadaceae bacterium]